MAKLHIGAIDCSFNNCGWSIIRYDGVTKQAKITAAGLIDNSEKILPKKDKSIDDLLRSQRLFENIRDDVIDKYTVITSKKAFAMEIPGGSQSSRAASCLGMARGVLGTVMTEIMNKQVIKHCIVLVKPTEVHKKATGSNVATKEEIIAYVCAKYKSQIEVEVKKSKTMFWITMDKETIGFPKGAFEHIADSLVIAELGLERLLKS